MELSTISYYEFNGNITSQEKFKIIAKNEKMLEKIGTSGLRVITVIASDSEIWYKLQFCLNNGDHPIEFQWSKDGLFLAGESWQVLQSSLTDNGTERWYDNPIRQFLGWLQECPKMALPAAIIFVSTIWCSLSELRTKYSLKPGL